jgi:thiaminase/transcriptional activator TenA
MRPTDQLRASIQETWDAATDHAFCRQLADGSLPPEKMRWYLVQDYKFVDHFVRLLATAIAHAPTLADAVPAAQFLGLVTSTENTYFLRSFEALGISEPAQSRTVAPATAAFQAVMEEARTSGSYAQMLAVLVVAEWSYLSWAERYTGYDTDLPFWFAEWIDLHSGAGFEGVVAYLRDQLDTVWEGLNDDARTEVTDLFQRAVTCELAFFDAAETAS